MSKGGEYGLLASIQPHLFIIQVVMSTFNGFSALLMPVTWLSMYGMPDINAATAFTAQA
jgi:hypothetical protein